MDTSAQRTDRLHAIWQRRCARFREAHCAYRLAADNCDRVGRQHPSYPQARALATRAASLMEILHRQTANLTTEITPMRGIGDSFDSTTDSFLIEDTPSPTDGGSFAGAGASGSWDTRSSDSPSPATQD